MTDLEINKACAEAMGIAVHDNNRGQLWVTHGSTDMRDFDLYDPLHDDAQAMALVKHCKLAISVLRIGGWMVGHESIGWAENADLNRAICECVARIK